MPMRMPEPRDGGGVMPRRSRMSRLRRAGRRRPGLEQVRPGHRLAHDEALCVADADQRPELGIAALDQLREQGRRQARGGGPVAGRRELRAMTRQGLPLDLVDVADVDDERGRRRVVDEVVADPLGPPRLLGGDDASQAGAEDRLAQQAAGVAVIGMPILPVRDGDGARPVGPDAADDGVDLIVVVGRQASVRQPQIEPERARRGRRCASAASATRWSGVPFEPSSPRVRSTSPTRSPRRACRATVPPMPISMSSGWGPNTSRSKGIDPIIRWPATKCLRAGRRAGAVSLHAWRLRCRVRRAANRWPSGWTSAAAPRSTTSRTVRSAAGRWK